MYYKAVRLFLIFLLAAAVLPNGRARAEGERRCLSNADCPPGQPCINRKCFQGLTIDIGSYKTESYKLAVAPPLVFSKEKKIIQTAEKLRRKIESNFRLLRGSFKVLSAKTFIEKPPYNGLELGTFKFKPWRSIGANGLIKLALHPAGKDRFKLMFRFYDVDAGRLALRFDEVLPYRYKSWKVHYFCDRVYSYLTGSPGIFRTKIAYVQRNPKGGKDIWIVNFDGSGRKRVVSNGALNLMPAWSPDGRYLAFVSYLKGRPHLYQLDLKTGRVKQLTSGKGTYAGPSYSPDGKYLAFSLTLPDSKSDSDIYLLQLGNGKILRLTESWGIDVTPSWSPDGKFIAFVSERFASPQIFVMKRDGSNQVRLTFRGDYNQEPRWSPRRNEILFTARDEYFQYDLFVITLEREGTDRWKTKYRRLTQNQGSNLEAVWSPDGRYILFISTRIGEKKIFLMNSEGTHQTLFLRGRGDFESPAWSPVLPEPDFSKPAIANKNFFKLPEAKDKKATTKKVKTKNSSPTTKKKNR